MCRHGGAGKAAARCWVGVPNKVMRLLVGQDLAEFRLATCLFLVGVPSDELRLLVGQDLAESRLATYFFRSLAAAIIVFLDADQDENMSQCGMCPQMCTLGVAGESAAHTHTSAHAQYIDLPLHVMFFLRSQNQVLRLEGIITEQFAALAFAHSGLMKKRNGDKEKQKEGEKSKRSQQKT